MAYSNDPMNLNAVTSKMRSRNKTLDEALKLKKQGKYSLAESYFKKAIQEDPTNLKALLEFSSFAYEFNKFDYAIEFANYAYKINPSCIPALITKGKALHAKSHLSFKFLEEAISCYQEARQKDPKNIDVIIALAETYVLLGNHNKVKELLSEALSYRPNCADLNSNLGIMHQVYGENEIAKDYFKKAIELNPKNTKSIAQILQLEKQTEINKLIKSAEKAANNKSLVLEDRIAINFALGKAYEDLQDYKTSFKFYKSANDLKAKTFLNYHPKLINEVAKLIKQRFTKEYIESNTSTKHKDKTPIFLVGLPRSGSTLAEQIICSHPQVFGAGEVTFMQRSIFGTRPDWHRDDFVRVMDEKIPEEDLVKMAETYLHEITSRTELTTEKHSTDKLLGNYLYIGFIKMIFPNAKIIHCKRNPMDSCFSAYKQNFTSSQEHTFSLKTLGNYYQVYKDLTDYWREIFGDEIYELEYEEMVADQEYHSRKLIDYCGLDWDDACLKFYENKRGVSTASLQQVRQKVYTSSIEKWRAYEDELKPLYDIIHTEDNSL